MRKLLIIVPVLLAAILALTTTAHAQYYDSYYETEKDSKPFSVHLGAGFLSGNTQADTVFIGGFDYQIPLTVSNTNNNNYFVMGVDYMPIGTFNNGTVSVIPIQLSVRSYGVMGGYRGYFQAGAGIRVASDDIPELRISSGAQFEWNAAIGVNITRSFFTQVRYLAGSNPSNDGVTCLELGYRF